MTLIDRITGPGKIPDAPAPPAPEPLKPRTVFTAADLTPGNLPTFEELQSQMRTVLLKARACNTQALDTIAAFKAQLADFRDGINDQFEAFSRQITTLESLVTSSTPP